MGGVFCVSRLRLLLNEPSRHWARLTISVYELRHLQVFIRNFTIGPFEDVLFRIEDGDIPASYDVQECFFEFPSEMFQICKKMYSMSVILPSFLSQQMDPQGSWYPPKEETTINVSVWQVDNNMLHVLYDQGSLYITLYYQPKQCPTAHGRIYPSSQGFIYKSQVVVWDFWTINSIKGKSLKKKYPLVN